MTSRLLGMLKGTRFDGDPRAFRVFITEAFFSEGSPCDSVTDEELLYHPDQAKSFCEFVRRALSQESTTFLEMLSDKIILKALTETRKRGERTKEQLLRTSAKGRRRS